MRDPSDGRIRRELKEQAPPLPEGYEERIYSLLEHLPEKDWKRRHYPWVAAVIVCLVVGTTAASSVKPYKQHLAQMSRGKISSIDSRVQLSKAGADRFTRELSEREKERMAELRRQYEDGKIVLNEELRTVDRTSEVPEGGICYCYEDSTFYLPGRELTDQELLSIIDFYYVRDYSVRQGQKQEQRGTSEAGGGVSAERAETLAADVLRKMYDIDLTQMETTVRYESGGEGQEAVYAVVFSPIEEGQEIEMEVNAETGVLEYLEIGNTGREMLQGSLREKSYVAYGGRIKEYARYVLPGKQLKETVVSYYVREEKKELLGSVRYYLVAEDGEGVTLYHDPTQEMPYKIVHFKDYNKLKERGKRDDEYMKQEYGAKKKTVTVK